MFSITKHKQGSEEHDMDKIGIAHALLEVANKRMTGLASELSKFSEKRSTCLSNMKRHSLRDITDSVVDNQLQKVEAK
jgi:hypothetical protein